MKFYAKHLFLFFILCSACTLFQSVPSPTETFKEYIKAIENKDLAGIKRTTSKKSIEMMEKMVEPGKTLEEMIQKEEPVGVWKNAEFRNEKINGDRATVEIKNQPNGTWMEFPLVKEEGRWKVAFAELLEETLPDFKKEFESLDKNVENSNKQNNK